MFQVSSGQRPPWLRIWPDIKIGKTLFDFFTKKVKLSFDFFSKNSIKLYLLNKRISYRPA